jgi:hypothetical protein
MFQIDSYYELNALLRAVIEAKFHRDPDDLDVPGSALLADVVNRLARAVAEESIKIDGDAARTRWSAWIHTGPERDEWKSAVVYAASMWPKIWPKWSVEDRRVAARQLLSPFELEDATLDAFLREVEASFTPVQ